MSLYGSHHSKGKSLTIMGNGACSLRERNSLHHIELGVNMIADSCSFIQLQSKYIGVRLEKIFGDGWNLLLSDQIEKF